MSVDNPGVLVCQHGARRRYAIPRMLEQAEMLSALYTDSSSVSVLGKAAGYLAGASPPSIRRLANRRPEGIPVQRIYSSDCCLLHELRKQFRSASSRIHMMYSRYHRLSMQMMKWGLQDADYVYSMYDESLDFIRWAKERGLRSLVDVFISPATANVMAGEYERFPDWGICSPKEDIDHTLMKWKEAAALADILICPSKWVAEGVCEVTPEAAHKVRIVPYGCSIDYEGNTNQPVAGRVLFAGGNALRKGLRYLAQAATLLKETLPELDVRIAGSLPSEIVRHPVCRDLNFLGKLTSEQIKQEYLAADVFVLPSLSEGFAGVVAEAIGAGCPVIVTAETGSPVVHEKEGLVIPSRDVEALSQAIERVVRDRILRDKLSAECRELADFYSEKAWQERLVNVVQDDWNEWISTRAAAPVRRHRVVVQQPALRRYRLPFYREWAGREGVSLKLLFSIAGEHLGDGDEYNFETQCVPMWTKRMGRRNLMWHKAQWQSATKEVCDVLVLSWNTQYLSLVPALVRARANGIKTILWGHGFSKDESRLRKIIRDAIGRLADALVFYDYVTARTFIEKGWSESRVYVAPNSLDQHEIQEARTRWLNQPDALQTFRKEHGLDGRRNVIYVGRIYEDNRLDVLIKAIPDIQARHPDFQLLVIGYVNEVARSLQRQAEALQVADRILWLDEIYEENKIAPFMLSSEIFCYPANIGLSIMHALGYGLPVVAGDNIPSHNPEIHVLRDGKNGSLFRHLDAADLAATICRLLDSPELISAMGTAAREDVLKTFTTQTMVDGFMKAIKDVCGESA